MEWTRTRSVLADLGKLLTCAICESYLKDPCTLDNCDHNFCRKCIEEILGSESKCPECGSFSWVKDLRPNHQLAMTVNMTLKLQSLIGVNMEVEDSAPQDDSESSSENTFTFACDEEMPGENCDEEMEIYCVCGGESVSTIKPDTTQCDSLADSVHGANMTKSRTRLRESNSFENHASMTAETTTENTSLKHINKSKLNRKHKKMTKQPSVTVQSCAESEIEANHARTTETTTEKTSLKRTNKSKSTEKHKKMTKQPSVTVHSCAESDSEAYQTERATETARLEQRTNVRNSATVRGNKKMTKQASATVQSGGTHVESESEASHASTVETITEKTSLKQNTNVRKSAKVRGNKKMTKQASATVQSGATDVESESEASHASTVETITEKTSLKQNTNVRKSATVRGNKKMTKQASATVQSGAADVESESEASHASTAETITEKTSLKQNTNVRKSATVRGNKKMTKQASATVESGATGIESESEASHASTAENKTQSESENTNVKLRSNVRKSCTVRGHKTMTKQPSSTVLRGTTDTESKSEANRASTAKTTKEKTKVKQNTSVRKSSLVREQDKMTKQSRVLSGITDTESDSDANNASTVETITDNNKNLKRHTNVRKSGAVGGHSKVTKQPSVTKALGNNTESDSEANHSTIATTTESANVKVRSNVRKSVIGHKTTTKQRTFLNSATDTESDIEANNAITTAFRKARTSLKENSSESKLNTVRRHNKITKQRPVLSSTAESDSETNEGTTKENTHVKQRKNVRKSSRGDNKMTKQPTVLNSATDTQSDSDANKASTAETMSIKGHISMKQRANVRKSATVRGYKKSTKQPSITEQASTTESMDMESTHMREATGTENTNGHKPAVNRRKSKTKNSDVQESGTKMKQKGCNTSKGEPTKIPQTTTSVHATSVKELSNTNESGHTSMKKSNRTTTKTTVENTSGVRPSAEAGKCSKRADQNQIVTKRKNSSSEKTGRKASEQNVLKTYLFRNILNPTSKTNSNLTGDRFDFTQQDPFHFSFTDAEDNGNGSDDNHEMVGNDHDNDDDHDNNDGSTKPPLRSISKSTSNTLSSDRRTRKEISNPFEFGHDAVEDNNRILQSASSTITRLRNKATSKVTAQQTIKKEQFTHLKNRPTNRDQKDQSAVEKDKKKTSSNGLTRPDPKVVDDEDKENATLNIKRRRVRSKNNIRQYFISVDNADTSENSSGDVPAPQKRKKSENPSTSPSQNPRNATTTPQSSQNAAASSQKTRNKKGETPLHLAAIKGNLALARELINEGLADPNVKDHAGWTPLHEACNHGHVDIVELFLNHDALINIPGLDNDTPLHDAVANGRLKVVKLLVARGAVLTARNKQGLLPMDYAVTKAMKAALTPRDVSSTSKPTEYIENVKKSADTCRESQVILGTALKTQDQVTLKKCIKQLGGTLVDEFDDSVTHVVTSVNENGHCPRTIKYLSGILSGKWIVSFEWIKDCLRQRQWLDEDVYEVEGTVGKTFNAERKARCNTLQQMPRLFDGCSFFLRGVFNPPTPSKQDIIKLINVGGGKLLHREPKVRDEDLTSLPSSPIVTSLSRAPEVAYHAPANSTLSCCTEFILYDSMSSDQPKIVFSPILRTAPVTWLMDCISSFQLLDIPDVQ